MNPLMPVLITRKGVGSSAVTNEKGYKKSLETGVLWLVHPQTFRLIPHQGAPRFLSLDLNGRALLAVLPGSAPAEPYLYSDAEIQKDADAVQADVAGKGDADNERGSNGGNGGLSFLATLEETVRKRKTELPEGSYTTHLFRSGAEKIRKKLGEEAVELILAPKKDHIVSESADLLYHLLVLLASEGISLNDVTGELRNRG